MLLVRMAAGLILSVFLLGAPVGLAQTGGGTLPAPEIPEHRHPGGSEAPEQQQPGGAEHVHPSPDHVHPQPAADSGKVGLEEQLGGYIPLDIAFRDENGQAVTLRNLIDGPTVIAPVYYKCPNVCAYIQGSLAQALPEVSLRPGEEYRVLSVSFDETDDPAVALKSKHNYFAAMPKDYPRDAWRFLTGDPAEVRRLTDSLGYYFQRQGRDFLHPVAIAVVARDGKIVRYLYGTRFLPMDLTLSLVEGSQGKVGATIKRVLGYCFSYDAANRRYVFNILKVSATVVLITLGSFLAFLLLSGRRTGKHGTKP